jgi:glycosyltransferase involved in cell wall biosynthesis
MLNHRVEVQSQSQTRANPAKRKLKVCHIAATTEGAHWMFEQLRDLRDKHGFDVAAVVSGRQGPLVAKLVSENIPFHVANFTAGSGSPRAILRMPFAILSLARILRRERYDVVQTHIFTSMVIGRPAAWLADVPVRTAMIAGPFHLQAYTSRWMERFTCWMETKLIPASEKSAQLLQEMNVPEKYLGPTIYYSPDERKFDPQNIAPANIRADFGWPQDTPLIVHVAYFYPRLSVGRWVPSDVQSRAIKGHEEIVRAAPIVLRELPEAKFLLVGSGWGKHGEAYREEIRDLIRKMGLESNVVLLGFRADANKIFRAADISLQPSLNENCGGSVEALLMECPIVATRVGGLVDTVRDGETGVLVRPSDPDDLARGILQLLRDPEKARAYGRAGRKLMLERFTLGKTVNDLAELYHYLISETEQKRESYDPFVSFARSLVALPVFLVIVFRLTFMDMFLPIYLPIYLARLRAVLIRVFHLSLSRVYRLRASLYRLRGLMWVLMSRLRAIVYRIPGIGLVRRVLIRLRSEFS